MPTPAPAAPRPPPRPRAMALPASEAFSGEAACARVVMSARSTRGLLWLVLLGDGAAEIDRGERGEDEGLQGRDKADLEEEEDDPRGEGDDAQRFDAQQHHQAAGHEQDDEVAGEDVGEETNGERDQPHEVREELEYEDEALHERVVDAGRDEALQVPAEPLRADAL